MKRGERPTLYPEPFDTTALLLTQPGPRCRLMRCAFLHRRQQIRMASLCYSGGVAMRAIARLAFLLLVWGWLAGAAAGTDAMVPREIEALQRRLTDAKCFAGPIDGSASAALDRAIAECPTQAPLLRIETGMHETSIKGIDVDRDCRIAATASDDKTVRLWSLPDGRPLRTLRTPIDAASESRFGLPGDALSVAVSPDGRRVVVGARRKKKWQSSLYVFDELTGALITRVGNFQGGINQLAFSADGHWLAVSTDRLQVLDTTTWQQVHLKEDYQINLKAAFGRDGRLFTVSWGASGKGVRLRRYGPAPTFEMQAEVESSAGHSAGPRKMPSSILVDPRGELVAVGFFDAAEIDVYDATTLTFRYAADAKGVEEDDLRQVSWLGDGSGFAAGGAYQSRVDTHSKNPLLIFDRDGAKTRTVIPLSYGEITNIVPCASGLAIAAADPAFGLLDSRGHRIFWREGIGPNMHDKVNDGLIVSVDAKRVRFGLGIGAEQPVLFSLADAALTEAPAAASDLTAAITYGLPIENWRNALYPVFLREVIGLNPNDERARSVAIRQDRAGFVLGGDTSLRAFDATGKSLWRSQAVPGAALGVNLSADGRIVVVAYDDGTVRWHRGSDGKELLALFVSRQTKAWVAWTPSGYYMASPGGEDMIGWHLNRGWDQVADFFPASRFRDRFLRPDIVKLILDTLDEGQAIKQANATAKRRADDTTVIQRLPPVLSITSPADGAVLAPGTAEIRYVVRSPSGAHVDRIEVFVDGAKVSARLVDGADRTESVATEGSVSVAMPAHDASISLVAYAGNLAGDPARVQLKARASARAGAEDVLKPRLYALLIGVSHYNNKAYDLGYAADDATGFAQALLSQKGRLYKDVQVKVLTDGQANSAAIKRGLSWLRRQATIHDLAIVFVAGHGLTDPKGKFWFLSADADPQELKATAVSQNDMTDELYDLPGKKLLFLDACHSGAALATSADGTRVRGLAPMDASAAINDFAAAEGGVVVYAASTGSEPSLEKPEWSHGAFTKALIEAIGEGRADLRHNGVITTAELDYFVADRVKELTGGAQHAVMTRPKIVPDFPIATVRQ